MNKVKIIERLLDREEFKEHWSKNNEDSQLSQISMYHQYVKRLLDILEDVDHQGIMIDDDNLIKYLQICEGGTGATKEASTEDMQRRQKLLSETLKGSVVTQVKNVADYAKKDFYVHLAEFIIVGIIIGILSFVVPHIWDLKASKEPIKVQIIQQSIPQSQSEPIIPENSTVTIPMIRL